MCPCDLSNEYVCAGCSAHIEELYRLLTVAESKGWDSARLWRRKLDAYGLKANIVIYRISNGERQHA